MWPRCRRPRLQFRLTTLMGLMAAIAVCAAVYGTRLRAEQRQETAFREIAARGGLIHVYCYGASVFFERPPPMMCASGLESVIEPAPLPRPFGDTDCRWLDDVHCLHSVHFPGSDVSRSQAIVFQGRHPQCRVSIRPFDD